MEGKRHFQEEALRQKSPRSGHGNQTQNLDGRTGIPFAEGRRQKAATSNGQETLELSGV